MSKPTMGGRKSRLRPKRGLKRTGTARGIIAGHSFLQNLRRGDYELGLLAAQGLTVAGAFDELACAV